MRGTYQNGRSELIGKNVVALGGGFSSGKSSFLNAMMGGRKILPEDLDPSTAVPTYIVRGKEHEAHGLNVFDAQITLNLRRADLRKIAHGFGEVTDDDDRKITDSITLGHVLKSVFFSTPLHSYEHLAFLDTPGYSKPDAAEYSVKTDEQIARGQLNTSNFILWFVPLEKNGTISQTDIDFIRTLREDIPKMVILSQSDKKDISNLRKIIERTSGFEFERYPLRRCPGVQQSARTSDRPRTVALSGQRTGGNPRAVKRMGRRAMSHEFRVELQKAVCSL